MSKNENFFRRGQRFLKNGIKLGSKTMTESGVIDYLEDSAKKVNILYEKTGLEDVITPVFTNISKSANYLKNKAVEYDEKLNISSSSKQVLETGKQQIYYPIRDISEDIGLSKYISQKGEEIEDIYGRTRNVVKPYFEAEDARELLTNTQQLLTEITACILQISCKDAEGWIGEFGKLISSKFAGFAGTATLFGVVSVFGTAGTGTAIATLSGAAASSATLASIGGLVGGGMAAGALVLTGFGVVVGMATYKLLSSTAREFDELSKVDLQVIETAGLLATAINKELDKDQIDLSAEEAIQFKVQSLDEFYEFLKENAEPICSRLDANNAIKFRQHILLDFKPVILDGFDKYAAKSPFHLEGIIGGIFYALLTSTALDGSLEQEMVLDALRRSTISLHSASEQELTEYLHTLSPEQMRGVANNVKGIYHELRHVDIYNNSHVDTYAEIYTSTNHQGSDVMIKSKETNEVVEEYQLKATDSVSYVKEHQTTYPDIPIKTTNDVASKLEGVETSGLSNFELTETTEKVLTGVAENTVLERTLDAMAYSGLIASGFQAISVLRGKSTPLNAAGAVAATAASTGITAFLFSLN